MDTIGEQQLKQAKLLVAFIIILVLLAVGGLYIELFFGKKCLLCGDYIILSRVTEG